MMPYALTRLLGIFLFLPMLGASSPVAAAGDDKLTISIDAPVVRPGETIAVVVTAPNDLPISKLTLGGEFSRLFDKNQAWPFKVAPPFRFDIRIPNNAEAGTYDARAVGLLADGRQITSETVDIVVVTTDEQISDLRFQFPDVELKFIGEYALLQPFAITSRDGILNVPSSAVCVSTNPLVASVDSSCKVYAVGKGQAYIDISAFGLSARASVQVSANEDVKGDLNADGAIDMRDISTLKAYIGFAASSPKDSRDLNGDRKIDALDLRVLTTLCTRPRCATP